MEIMFQLTKLPPVRRTKVAKQQRAETRLIQYLYEGGENFYSAKFHFSKAEERNQFAIFRSPQKSLRINITRPKNGGRNREIDQTGGTREVVIISQAQRRRRGGRWAGGRGDCGRFQRNAQPRQGLDCEASIRELLDLLV